MAGAAARLVQTGVDVSASAPYRAVELPPLVIESVVANVTCIVTITGEEIVWKAPTRGRLAPALTDEDGAVLDEPVHEVARVRLAEVRRVNAQRVDQTRVCMVFTRAGASYPIEDDDDELVVRTLHERLRGRDDVEFRIGTWSGALVWSVGAVVAWCLLVFFGAAVRGEFNHHTAPDPQAQRALIIALGLCAITGVVAPLMAWRARPRRFEPGARTRW